jgi:HD-like signal output (HDOD) protein
MSKIQYRRVLTKVGLNLVPPIPSLTGHETWVDIHVDNLDHALIDVTGNREYLLVTREQIQGWLAGHPRVDVCMLVQEFDPHQGIISNDQDQINASIRKFTKLRIERRLKDTLDLPPLPSVVRKIISLRSNPNATVNELVAILECDPTLAANVMRWSNSSYYSMSGNVNSLHDAVNRVLGYDMVMNLCMGLVLGNVMNVPKHETTHVLNFWEQATWMAHGMAHLSEQLPPDKRISKGLAYLAGLLHNFGYLILSHTFPPHFRIITESTDINRHLDVSLIDAHILGITREQVAACLMDNWMIPKEVVNGIRYQKQCTFNDEHWVFANLLYLTRAKLIEHGVALGAPMTQPDFLFERLGLTSEGVDSHIDDLLKREEQILNIARMM